MRVYMFETAVRGMDYADMLKANLMWSKIRKWGLFPNWHGQVDFR